ncbi:hypothetical protein FQA45_04670 [Glutamicibacter halophytocola]|uniref:Uncharacterized protein n=1 Tax=Glutamicibacter halophytocola TaxID=1933880 RepID=A0ABX5Y6C6_9MICC|nr:hypothetical protein FQA45_04670 [Glutamicibacter halophytocola]
MELPRPASLVRCATCLRLQPKTFTFSLKV